MKTYEKLNELIKACHWMNQQGYSPATSGNYSVRVGNDELMISASGVDKGNLQPSDFLKIKTSGDLVDRDRKPSDESAIHARIMALHPEVECVLHSHSLASTIVSLKTREDCIVFKGFEMQKAFTGIGDHKTPVRVNVIENTQAIPALAKNLQKQPLPCFILRGHGVYTWGNSIAQAKRHLQGIEFLLQCKLELMRHK